MSYTVALEPSAEDDVARLPEVIRSAVMGRIGILAAAPSRAGTTPARFPYPLGQLYRADFPAGGVTCQLDVVFKYGADEQTLHILRIYVEYD